MVLALGVVSAMLDAQRGGRGQVVDASMVAGAALLTTLFYGLHAHGEWGPRGTNPLDSGAPCYEVYRTADDRYVCIGSLEPQFYAALRAKLDLTDPMWDRQMDPAAWPAQKDELARVFATRTRAEWTDLLEGTDVCFAPVLSLAEAPGHEQNRANGTFVDIDGIVQPAPGPAFGRTTLTTPTAPPVIGEHTEQLLAEFGYAPEEIERLRVDRAVA
jgi:alpha-methylacyl-CoA racemase